MGYPNSPGHTPEISIDPRELKHCSLEEPLLNGYGVARPDRERQRRRKCRWASINEAGDFDAALDRARREAAGDRDRLLDGHAHNERVLPGERDFAEHEEGPIGLDLHGNARFAQETLTKPRLDCALELRRRKPLRPHPPDERYRDIACAVDRVGVAEIVLAEHDHPQAIAAA